MKECDILRGGVKIYSDPSYISLGGQDPQPQDLRPWLEYAIMRHFQAIKWTHSPNCINFCAVQANDYYRAVKERIGMSSNIDYVPVPPSRGLWPTRALLRMRRNSHRAP